MPTLLLDLIGWLALALTVVFIASSLILLAFGDALTDHDPALRMRTTDRPEPDDAVLASSVLPLTSGPATPDPDQPHHPVAA